MESARVPQHLELEDVVAWNLGALDLLCLLAGAVVGWWLYLQLPDPIVSRIAGAGLAVLVGAATGVVRLGGLPLRGWIAAGVAFVVRPRLFVTRGRA
ncbi:MAG: hypothetical protein ACYDHH_32770 [Solirubrobacteraceae bacterium]